MNSSGTTVQSSDQGPSTAQLISGGTSFFSMFTDRQQSIEASRGLRSTAQGIEQNARVEKVNADATKNELQRRLGQTLADNAAALSIANVDPTSGSARLVQEQSVGEFNNAFMQTDLNSRIRVSQLKRQAAQARADAAAVNRAGKTKMLLDFGTSIAKFSARGAF